MSRLRDAISLDFKYCNASLQCQSMPFPDLRQRKCKCKSTVHFSVCCSEVVLREGLIRTKLQLAGALGGGAGQQTPLFRLQLLQLRRLCHTPCIDVR